MYPEKISHSMIDELVKKVFRIVVNVNINYIIGLKIKINHGK